MSVSATVPITNDTNAACHVPTALPSIELIGACSATSPPVNAVSRTAAPRSTLLRLHPRRTDADVDGQRRVVHPHGAHLAADELAHAVDLVSRALEEQLVVDRQDRPHR